MRASTSKAYQESMKQWAAQKTNDVRPRVTMAVDGAQSTNILRAKLSIAASFFLSATSMLVLLCFAATASASQRRTGGGGVGSASYADNYRQE